MPKTAAKNAADPKVIRRLRDKEDLSWAKIADQVGVSASQAMLLYGQADSENAITGTDEAIKKKIAAERKKGLSWGILMSRSGWGLQRCRNAFEEVTGESALGNTIGHGGRPPGSGNGTAMKVKKAVKKASKKAPVKKAAKKAPAKKAKKAPAKKRAAKKSAASSEAG